MASFGSAVTVTRMDPEDCAKSLASGASEVALIPTLTALKNGDVFDVLPSFAVSSWGYPFARITLPEGLNNLTPVLDVPASHPQEAFIASVILQEHYGVRVQTILDSAEQKEDSSAGSTSKQALVVGEAAQALSGLDLGQEWYELTNYPMVWGVFATLKGNANPHLIRGMADAAAVAERVRQEGLIDMDDNTAEFFGADLRFRFDDLATASITELTQYLFFYQGNDEIDELAVVHLPDDEESAEDQPLV